MKPSKPRAPEDSDAGYRTMLLEKREQVLAGRGLQFDTLARMGRVAEEDQAQISHEEFISVHLNSLDYTQMRLVQEALGRLDAGDYGICLGCEEPIPAKRLKAIPWARYCVRCQEEIGKMEESEEYVPARSRG